MSPKNLFRTFFIVNNYLRGDYVKKVLFTLLAVLLLAKNVYSTEVSKNFYMLLPALHCDNGKISTEKVDDKKYVLKFKIIEVIDGLFN